MQSSKTNFSTTLAIISVLFFIFSTLLICICAYCLDFKRIFRMIIFCWRPKHKYEYHRAMNNDHDHDHDHEHGLSNGHIFSNDHFTSETPLPSDEIPMTWRNAVIMGTPPYRKFTTVSTNELPLSRNGSSKRDCVISAV